MMVQSGKDKEDSKFFTPMYLASMLSLDPVIHNLTLGKLEGKETESVLKIMYFIVKLY